MSYGLTADEQARLGAVAWPQKLEVARQLDAERAEREAEGRQAEDTRRYEETLAYAAHTRQRADQETRNHAAGRACDTIFCRYEHDMVSTARAINEMHDTKPATARLQELFGVSERAASAMLTIAAELGEYQHNGIVVIGDDDAQQFLIRLL